MPLLKRILVAVAILCWSSVAHSAVEPELKEFLASPFQLAIRGYQRWGSPAKGSQCPMVPSDSEYARQAIRRYGIFQGGLLTADRLHRCGHDLNFYPIVSTSAGLKFQDPLPDLEQP